MQAKKIIQESLPQKEEWLLLKELERLEIASKISGSGCLFVQRKHARHAATKLLSKLSAEAIGVHGVEEVSLKDWLLAVATLFTNEVSSAYLIQTPLLLFCHSQILLKKYWLSML